MISGEDMVEKGGFPASEKSGDDSYWNHEIIFYNGYKFLGVLRFLILERFLRGESDFPL